MGDTRPGGEAPPGVAPAVAASARPHLAAVNPWRTAAQAAVSIAGAAVLSRLAWGIVGHQLSIRTDIVGATIFYDRDIYRDLDHFYIAVILLPALAALLFFSLTRWGPLRARDLRPPWPPALSVGDTTLRATAAVEQPSRMAAATVPSLQFRSRPLSAREMSRAAGAIARVALPALVLAAEVEIGRSARATGVNGAVGITVLVAYGAAVALLTLALRPGHHRSLEHCSAINAVLATAVVPMLLLVSASTAVSVLSDHRVAHYPWFPVWLAAAVTAGILVLIGLGLKRGGWAAARRAERVVLLIVVGPVALFLLTAVLQGAQGAFSGYDDAMSMTGAHLLFADGLWPWRNVFLLHGFLDDAFYGQLGMWVFGATRWGSNSGLSFLVAPLTVISLFSFIVYFARRNYALVVGAVLAVVLGLLVSWPGTRFLLLPPIFVLFDLVLRQGSWRRCFALMALVVLTSIVTPETTILVLGILVILVAAELTHHRWGSPLGAGLLRTVRCAVAGVTLTAGWVGFLLLTGCLTGFINYYLAVISGHELWGALPIPWPFVGPGSTAMDLEFVLPLVLYMLTAGKIVWKLHTRAPWRTAEWTLVAAATFVPLYYSEALDRLDLGHVDVLFQALVPLVLLWSFEIVRALDSWIVRAAAWLRDAARRLPADAGHDGRSNRGSWPWITVTPAAVAATVAVAIWSPQSLGAWSNIPGNFHASVPAEAPTGLPLGYTIPGSVDTTQLEDLGAVLDRYAGPSAPVFDFTNEPGVTFFMLNRVPGVPFYHIGAAQTVDAQQLEIAALESSRPPVVIFNNTTFGLPNYDGISSMEREFLVSQYILDNYQPILDVQGQLIMLRDDLLNTAPPPPPLKVPPITTGLYFADVMPCAWGDIPDFFDPPTPTEIRAGVPVPTVSEGDVTSASGWAFDSAADRPPAAILAVSDGVVIAQTEPTLSRPDVVAYLRTSSALITGWTLSASSGQGTAVSYFTLNADGTVTLIPGSGPSVVPSSIRTPHGRVYQVIDQANSGHVDVLQTGGLAKLVLNVSSPLSAYQWVEFQSTAGFGQATIELTDRTLGGQPSHVISFQTLPSVGHSVYLRVGSCIQWHGYQPDAVDLVVQGEPLDMSLRLLP